MLQSLIFGVGFFLILVLIFLILIYPKVLEIQLKKQELSSIYDRYNTAVISWLDFSEVRSQLLNGDESDYTRVLLKNVTEDFYKEHFTNTGSTTYTEYLENIRTEISNIKSSDEYLKRDKSLNVFLPTYVNDNTSGGKIFGDQGDENSSVDMSKTLSDFYFINYIENLLYSFNLSYQWDIWVGDIVNIDQDNSNDPEWTQDLLEENIFAIPLSFSFTWRKADIVDFLHYFENVAVVEISDAWFNVPNDNFISKRIEWSQDEGVYNIYENQLADIVSLSVSEYPNSSVKTTESLVFAMKTLQWNEKYEMDVELQFYVAGVPGYKMQAYINKLFENYTIFAAQLKTDTQKFLNQKYKFSNSVELTAIQRLQNLEAMVLVLEQDINDLRRESAQGNNIEEIYNTATEYNQQLEKINQAYQEQLSILIK